MNDNRDYIFTLTRRDGDDRDHIERTVTAANEHQAIVEIVALFIEHGGRDPRVVAAQYVNSQLASGPGSGWAPEDFYGSHIEVWFGSTVYYDFALKASGTKEEMRQRRLEDALRELLPTYEREKIKAALDAVAPEPQLGVKTWILSGEINETVTEPGALMRELAGALNSANTTEILGSVLFIGTDEKLYTITVEAEVGEPSQEFAQSLIDDIAPEDIGPEARAILERHGLKVPEENDCLDCGHPWDEHNNQTGCQHTEEGEDCDCPNKRGYDI